MVNIRKLKGAMVEKGMSQKSLATCLGINDKTLGRKMKSGKFNSNEMEKMIEVLEIKNPIEIFFCDN